MAPFSGFIWRDAIPEYAKQLQALVPFQAYDFSGFDAAVQEAINWGLLSPLDESERLLTIQPVFPYFLKIKLASLDESTRTALTTGFKNHYRDLAASYQQWMKSKEPQEKQVCIWFCRQEYENLYQALLTCLADRESINIFFCLDKYYGLINDIFSNLKLSEFVCCSLESYPVEIRTDEIGWHIIIALDRLADCYWQTKDYGRARSTYQNVVELKQTLTGVEETQIKSLLATTYHQLGIVAQELREYEQARSNYQQALAIYVEFNDRYSQAATYHQLGIVAQELREYEQARSDFQQALAIKIEFNDRYSQAGTYGQLGLLVEAEGNLPEAKANLLQALEIFAQFQDAHSLGIAAGNLARIYAAAPDDSLLAAMAQILGVTVEDLSSAISQSQQ